MSHGPFGYAPAPAPPYYDGMMPPPGGEDLEEDSSSSDVSDVSETFG